MFLQIADVTVPSGSRTGRERFALTVTGDGPADAPRRPGQSVPRPRIPAAQSAAHPGPRYPSRPHDSAELALTIGEFDLLAYFLR